jgi:glycosyltransferase involved in cell wall biosynthesis
VKVLYLHQFFPGERSPGPAQPRFLVRALAARGHDVHVLACDFNAYTEHDEVVESEVTDAAHEGSWRVHRLRAPRNMRAGLRRRLATYTAFAWAGYRQGRRMAPPDVVMATIQPLFAGFAALRLARHWRVPFLLEVRDLWPDALVAKHAISPAQAAPLQYLAHLQYRGADRVVSLTPGIKTELLRKGVEAAKLDLFPNGFNQAHPFHGSDRAAIRDRYGWGDKFVAVYTGAHTEVTAIDVIVRAAAHLRDRRDVRLDLFGAGQTKASAVRLARELELSNVHFHDPVAKAEVPGILAGADAALMTLFESPLIHIYFENKLIDYMGAGRGILAALDGVQADLIRREGAGRVVPGLDHAGLARLIRGAADDRDDLERRGVRGHAFVTRHLDQRTILDRYVRVLEALASGEGHAIGPWDPLGLS